MKKSLILTRDTNYWFVADFETTTANTNFYKKTNDTRVIYYNIRGYNDELIKSEGVSIDGFMNYLFSLQKSCTIFFHNLAFDGGFISKWLALQSDWKYDFSNGECDDRDANKTFYLFRNGRKIYYIVCRFRTKNSFARIIFRCSYLLLSSSIGSLGKALGIKKHNDVDGKDFYDVEPVFDINEFSKRYLEYGRNDTLIQVKSLKNFVNCISNLPMVKKFNEIQQKKNKKGFSVLQSFTVASLSFRLMKLYVNIWITRTKQQRELKGANRMLLVNNNEGEIMRNWFRGGWTQFNNQYQGNRKKYRNIYYIDVNSAYPYQMTQLLPYGDLLEEKPIGEYVVFKWVKIKSATIKHKYRNMLTLLNWDKVELKIWRYVRKITKPVEIFYTKREWDLIKKFYDVEIIWEKELYAKAKNYLKEYVNELYKARQDFGKEGNEAFKLCIKILLNSGYGCLAQRDSFDSYAYVPKDIFKDIEKGVECVFGSKVYKFKYLTDSYYIDKDKYDLGVFQPTYVKSRVRNVLAASVITSNQRCYLWETIDFIGVENFAYCDTDSIIFVNLDDKQIEKLKSIEDRTQLGRWKIEDDGSKMLAIFGAKKYIMEDDNENITKFGFAGIGGRNYNYEELKLMNFDDDVITLKESCSVLKETKSGYVIETIDKKIRRGEN